MLTLSLAAAGGAWNGPQPGDYSGFMDYEQGQGLPDDPRGPLCGNPAVGFGVPGTPPTPNRRITQDWPDHWSKSRAGVDVAHPGWVIGTDGAFEDYGFYWTRGDVPSAPHSWAGILDGGLVELRIRNIESRQVKDYESGGWHTRGPALHDPSEQSDGWFRFRVRVNAGNYPSPDCPDPIDGPCIPFRLNMGNTGHGISRFFTEGGYDWRVFRPLYRTVVCDDDTPRDCQYGSWRRAEHAYTPFTPPGDPRSPEAIFAVPVDPAECPLATGCFIEVAQMQPYTKLDRDAFVDEVEQFCATSPHCNVYRGGAKPWTSWAPAKAGLAGLPPAEPPDPPPYGPAEENDFVFIEFAPNLKDATAVRPQNVILITAGVHYEPNTMFAAEGVVRALIESVSLGDGSLVLGGGTPARAATSYAIVFGASPDNLSWATTHVAPWGDGLDMRVRLNCHSTWYWDETHGTVEWLHGGSSVQAPMEFPDEFLWNTQYWAFFFSANPIWPLSGTAGYAEYVLTPPCNGGAGCYADYGFDDEWCRQRYNDDPESHTLRYYFASLAGPQHRLGHQVILHLDLHGDIAPHPDTWFSAIPNFPTRFPPPYGIWWVDGTLAEGVDPPLPFSSAKERVTAFAASLRPGAPHATPLSWYFRPFDQWWGRDGQFEDTPEGYQAYQDTHNYRRSPPFTPAPIGGYAPYYVVIELEETGLYRFATDPYPFENGVPPELEGSVLGDCYRGPYYKPTSEGGDTNMQFCVDGRIDTPWIFEQWGRTIVWGARETFANHAVVVRPLSLYCNADADAYYASTATANCTTDGNDCPVGDCITWPGDDCDDTEASVGPGGIETCDGLDNDCNGVTDDGGDALCPAFTDPCNIRQVCAGAAGCVSATDTDGDELADVDEPTWSASAILGDTDGDGLLDKTEACVAQGGLCPKANVADSDGDGLDDGAEAQLGTDYCSPDTDDDQLGDAEDPTPTDPGAPRAYLEAECRALGDFIATISVQLFNGSTTMEKKAKRTGLAAYAYTAANKLASNLNDPEAAALAEEQLLALQLYVDGTNLPDDWMSPSNDKTAVYDETDLLLFLLAYL